MARNWTAGRTDPDEFRRQYAAAVARAAAAQATEPRATSARYDAPSRSVIVQLRDGTAVPVPVSRFPELAQMTDILLQTVCVTASGYGLHWDEADVHLAVPHVVDSVRRG